LSFLKTFYPDEYVDSAYEIDYEGLLAKGYRALIFDIDNTLVPHDAPATKEAEDFLGHVKSLGFQVCFLSNNNEARVLMFNEHIGLPYIYKAGKPKASAYQKAMTLLGTTAKETVMIGDQLFTDVWGAGNAGVHCILCKPINPHERWTIKLKRILETIVLASYRRQQAR